MQSSTFRRSAGISCLPVKGVGPLRESEPSGSHPGCSPGGRRFESGRSPLKALHLRIVDPEQRGAISRRAAKLSSAAAPAWTAHRQRGKLAGARSRLVAVSRSEQVATAQRAERTSLPKGVVTFLLTDVEGSSRLWEATPAAMRAAISLHDELLERAVAASGGRSPARAGRGRQRRGGLRGTPPRRSPARSSCSAGCGRRRGRGLRASGAGRPAHRRGDLRDAELRRAGAQPLRPAAGARPRRAGAASRGPPTSWSPRTCPRRRA